MGPGDSTDGIRAAPARTYRLPNKEPLVLGFSAVSLLLVVGVGVFLLRHPANVWAIPHRVLGAGLVLWAFYGLRRTIGTLRSPPRVVVDAAGLTAYNLDTPTRHAPKTEISAISLQTMHYGRSRVAMSVPLATTKDGSAFWLDGLAARQSSAPSLIETQRMQLQEIRSILKLPPTTGPDPALGQDQAPPLDPLGPDAFRNGRS
jgi:hypothetical protein